MLKPALFFLFFKLLFLKLKMNKTLKLLGIFSVIALLGLLTYGYVSYQQVKSVCYEGWCFRVYVADTPDERSQGLMFVQDLPQEYGMLFIFPGEGNYSFWMKNTLIPLDIIWIDKDLKVVSVVGNVQPCQAEPCPTYLGGNAKYVLEVNGGAANRTGLVPGTQMLFVYD
jgi:uncharacterized membrane protein (UPF0127 family)